MMSALRAIPEVNGAASEIGKCTFRTRVAGPPKSALEDEADIQVGDGRFRRLRRSCLAVKARMMTRRANQYRGLYVTDLPVQPLSQKYSDFQK
jgi:hypothetical protein